MKSLAVCALLFLVPLVHGAALQAANDADVDLIPDISKAEDGEKQPALDTILKLLHQISDVSVTQIIRIKLRNSGDTDEDLVPDISNSDDSLPDFRALLKGALHNSLPSEALDEAADNADLVPDFSVAEYANDNGPRVLYKLPQPPILRLQSEESDDTDLVPDISVAEDANDNDPRALYKLVEPQVLRLESKQSDDADLIPDISEGSDASDEDVAVQGKHRVSLQHIALPPLPARFHHPRY